MTRGNKWLAWAGGSIIALILLLAVGERLSGVNRLRATLRGLEARGESLKLETLIPPPVPREENAIEALRQWFDVMFSRPDWTGNATPPTLGYATPGRVRLSVHFTNWTYNARDGGRGILKTNDWPGLRAGMGSYEELVEFIHACLARPKAGSVVDYQSGFLTLGLPPAYELRHASGLLPGFILSQLNEGNTAGAHTNLMALLRLGELMGEDRLTISEMIRTRPFLDAFGSLWQGLQIQAWSEAQITEQQRRWEAVDFLAAMESALVLERAMSWDFNRKLEHTEAAWAKLAELGVLLSFDDAGLLPAGDWPARYVHRPLWNLLWREHDFAQCLETWQAMIEVQRMARTNGYAALKQSNQDPELLSRMLAMDFSERDWYGRLKYVVGVLPRTSEIGIVRSVQMQVVRNLVIMGLALKRYELKVGRLPDSLAELVPEFVAAIPPDPMDNQPLRYRRLPHEEFLLYSIGANGVDDGGDPAPAETASGSYQIWDGRDAVWPAVASP